MTFPLRYAFTELKLLKTESHNILYQFEGIFCTK